MQERKKYLIVVTGPTAIGKTAFSIRLAQHYNTEIVSADSRQFYREMRIGTAYPEPGDLAAVKHHFIGNLSIKDDYNVARYEEDALKVIARLHKSHDVIVLTGGSGLYINAVCKGIDELPDHDEELRKQLQREIDEIGLEAFSLKLKELDPEYYEVVDQQNPNRLLRAMEVCMQTGQTYTSLRRNASKERNFKILKIGLNTEREILFKRIAVRVDRMMEKGLLDEVRSLIPYRQYNALNTVGYKELFTYLDGELSLEKAVENIKTNTRRYAKRQLTWFRKDSDIKWYEPGEFSGVLEWIVSNS